MGTGRYMELILHSSHPCRHHLLLGIQAQTEGEMTHLHTQVALFSHTDLETPRMKTNNGYRAMGLPGIE